MEQRKAIEFGTSSLCITLPHTWVKKHQVNKGDVINVQETLRSTLELFPTTTKTDATSDVTINIGNKSSDEITQRILASYLNGYTEITLLGEHEGQLPYLRAHIEKFIAAKIMEEDPKKIIIKIFWDIEAIDLQSISRRIDHIIRDMFEETKEILEYKNKTHDIIQKEVEIQRQILLTKRLITCALNNSSIAQKFDLTTLDLHYMASITYFAGKIAEYIPTISQRTRDPDTEKYLTQGDKGELSRLLIRTQEYYTKVMDRYHKISKDQTFAVSEYEEFQEEIEVFRENNNTRKRPLPGEYLLLTIRAIKELEFTMINLENAPNPQAKKEEKQKESDFHLKEKHIETE